MRRTHMLRLCALILTLSLLLGGCAFRGSDLRELVSAIAEEVNRELNDGTGSAPQGDDRTEKLHGADSGRAEAPAEPEAPQKEYGEETRWSTLPMVPFDEMPYEAPDLDAIRAGIDEATALLASGADAETVADQVAVCDAAYYTFYTMYTLADLRYYQDVTDSYYAAAYDECEAASLQVDRMINDLYTACADSPLREELETIYFGEDTLESYRSDLTETDAAFYDAYYALMEQETALLAQYRAAISSPTVEFRGKTVSYAEAIDDPFLDGAAYDELTAAYYDKYTEILGEIYLQLIDVRTQVAALSGYDSYEAYAFDMLYARDYTSEDADRFAADVRTYIAPLYCDTLDAGLWDLRDYPAVTEQEIVAQTGRLAADLGGSVAETWNYLDRYGLYDVRISQNKLATSFQTYLEDYEAPFALVKTYGYCDDFLAVSHEFGHCVDAYVNNNDTGSLELCETFSQAMEYLLLCDMDDDNMTTIKLLDTLDTYAQQCSFHDFEKQVYALPESERTVERINEISLQTAIDYGYLEPGEEDYYAKSWIDIGHFFEQPFYVISYCVSNDAAFQIYRMELASPGAGIAQYEELLPREHPGFLETLENQSGLQSPFAAGRMEETADFIRAYFGLA